MYWTLDTLKFFDAWLRERGGRIIFPVHELYNGSFVYEAVEPDNMTLEEAIKQFEKEHANDNAS